MKRNQIKEKAFKHSAVTIIIAIMITTMLTGCMSTQTSIQEVENSTSTTNNESVESSNQQNSIPTVNIDGVTKVPGDILYEYGQAYVGQRVVSNATVSSTEAAKLKLNTSNNDTFFFSFICEFDDMLSMVNIVKDDEIVFVGTVDNVDSNWGTVTLKNCSVVAVNNDAKEIIKEIENNRKEQTEYAQASKAEAEAQAEALAEEEKEAYKEKCIIPDYSDIERYPDNHKGEEIVVSGTVLQASDGWFDSVTLRVEDDDYNTWYVTYTYADGDARILVDDNITIFGECKGVSTYTSIVGSSITIPSIDAKIIEFE